MAKTRRQSKNTQHTTTTANMPPAPIPKKSKQIEKMPLVNKQKLREKMREKLLNKDLGCVSRKSIDLSTLQLQSMVIRQRLNCPICLQMMIRPVLTHCGHTFCLPCIEQSLKHKSMCSLCREPTSYQHFKQSKFIEKLIAKIEEAAPEEEANRYRTRLQQFRQQDEKRRVSSSVKVGNKIDLYLNGFWKEGEVVQVNTIGQSTTLAVKSGEKVHEFSLSSRLIAKHQCFTMQRHLFDYPLGDLWLRFDEMVPIFAENNNPIRPIFRHQLEDSDSDYFQLIFHDI